MNLVRVSTMHDDPKPVPPLPAMPIQGRVIPAEHGDCTGGGVSARAQDFMLIGWKDLIPNDVHISSVLRIETRPQFGDAVARPAFQVAGNAWTMFGGNRIEAEGLEPIKIHDRQEGALYGIHRLGPDVDLSDVNAIELGSPLVTGRADDRSFAFQAFWKLGARFKAMLRAPRLDVFQVGSTLYAVKPSLMP